MAYGTYDRILHTFIDATSALPDVHALEVAAADLGLAFDVLEPITVVRFGYQPTVLFNYDTLTAQGIISLDRRVLYASDTGRVELETLDLLSGAVAGTVYMKDFAGVNCDVGDQLVLEASTAATGGGSIAGDFIAFFAYHRRAETKANQLELLVSVDS